MLAAVEGLRGSEVGPIMIGSPGIFVGGVELPQGGGLSGGSLGGLVKRALDDVVTTE